MCACIILQNPDGSLRKRMAGAQAYAERRVLTQDASVYNTARGDRANLDVELEEFERRLNARTNAASKSGRGPAPVSYPVEVEDDEEFLRRNPYPYDRSQRLDKSAPRGLGGRNFGGKGEGRTRGRDVDIDWQ